MVIFLNVVVDGSLFDIPVVQLGLVFVCVHVLIDTMKCLMLIFLPEPETRLLQACKMFLWPFLLLCRLLWPRQAYGLSFNTISSGLYRPRDWLPQSM